MLKFISRFTYLVGIFATVSSAENSTLDSEAPVWFTPENLLFPNAIFEGDWAEVVWFSNLPNIDHFTATPTNEIVSDVVADSINLIKGSETDNFTYAGGFNLSATQLGFNRISIQFYDVNDEVMHSVIYKTATVLKSKEQIINDIFVYTNALVICFTYGLMGATIDLTVVKEILKKPIGPAIGIIAQYVFMPMISFGIGLVLLGDSVIQRLGMFLNGCSPGGGQSNMFTHLLGGSLNLSIMMTFVSTMTSFGIIPAWVFGMGPVILGEDADFVIPFTRMMISGFMLVVPCGIGLLIQRFFPRLAKICVKLVTPMSLFSIVYVFSFGVYAYQYVFKLLTWKILLSGFCLPFFGYLSGAIVSRLFKRPKEEIIAISIETGIQNAAVAIFILKFSLQRPASELGIVIPGSVVLFTPVPLLIAYIIKKVKECCSKEDSMEDRTKAVKETTNGVSAVTDSGNYKENGIENYALDYDDGSRS